MDAAFCSADRTTLVGSMPAPSMIVVFSLSIFTAWILLLLATSTLYPIAQRARDNALTVGSCSD